MIYWRWCLVFTVVSLCFVFSVNFYSNSDMPCYYDSDCSGSEMCCGDDVCRSNCWEFSLINVILVVLFFVTTIVVPCLLCCLCCRQRRRNEFDFEFQRFENTPSTSSVIATTSRIHIWVRLQLKVRQFFGFTIPLCSDSGWGSISVVLMLMLY